MKDLLLSIAALLALVMAFSTVETSEEFHYPFGNWAVPSNDGQPAPGEGEQGDGESLSAGQGKSHVFSIGKSNQAANEQQDYCPITVEVVTEQKKEIPTWFFIGVGIYEVICCGFTIYFYAIMMMEVKI